MRAGLRFHQRDAAALRDLANRVRTREIPGDVTTFEQAELAARTGEPLEVHCTGIEELRLVALGYANCGVTPSAIETLTSR